MNPIRSQLFLPPPYAVTPRRNGWAYLHCECNAMLLSPGQRGQLASELMPADKLVIGAVFWLLIGIAIGGVCQALRG